jgi:predicted phosphodiesterase
MRIFAISDIHIDFQENAQWIRSLSKTEFVEDLLILAGDISDSIYNIAKCFELLSKKFKTVFYVPGNHELWVKSGSPLTSIDKFWELLNLAHDFGIVTQAKTIHEITIIPMFSWYDLSFGLMTDELQRRWMDFTHCKWPEGLDTPAAQNNFFLDKNSLKESPTSETVITFSHFLPRIDLMPHYIPTKFRDIYPVLGSPLLDNQIRALQSDIHIYGHSHVNHNTTVEGIRYINNAFGYPYETRITAKSLIEILDNRQSCLLSNL